jgi:signal transduction histidine kinase
VRLARIHELEEQHRTLLDNAPLIIFRLEADEADLSAPTSSGLPNPANLALVYLNRHAERLLGVPMAEALGTRGFLRAAHADPEGVAAFDAAVESAAGGARSLPYEARLSRRGGEAITVRGSVYPLLAEGGHVAAIEGVLADVSAEHAARTRLVQADRLSTLGMLAAGVAHEINNPAAFILLGLDLLDRQLAGPGVLLGEGVAESARETLRELRDSIRRIVDIARDLRLFASAPASGRRAVVDVNRTVESALSLTRGQILERAQIELDLGDVPPVLMDDGRLGQVVVNLLVNAAQAIPRSFSAEQRIAVSTRSDGRAVEIEVEDTGVGIPEENLARMWQPFFTTKSPAEGTGLGLSISRDIVERAGGTIVAHSPARPGLAGRPHTPGARFVITLPAAGQSEPALAPQSPVPAAALPAARVLIVDDELSLARALAEEIGRLHHVTVAGGAEAALARLAESRFDVVLCDLRMPGMSGEALYARVREQDPEQAEGFVFMTGVGFGAGVEDFFAAPGRLLLEKPFPAGKALEMIARVMKRRALA